MDAKQKSHTPLLQEGQRFGIVGGGNMAKALMLPLFQKGLMKPENVIVSCTSQNSLLPWTELGCATTTDNTKVTSTSDVVMWAVKPQMFAQAVPAKWNCMDDKYSKSTSLHFSVMAGITLENFRQRLLSSVDSSYNLRCIRTMPNCGAQVGSGILVYTIGPDGTEEDKKFMQDFASPTGLVSEVPERLLNAYSALMGCGIGFMFPIIEAMSDGAVKVGIPRAVSLRMAAQVMKGAAELVLEESAHPGVLKDRICSPGGSTICGVAELEKHGVRNAFISAIEASTKRGDELAALK